MDFFLLITKFYISNIVHNNPYYPQNIGNVKNNQIYKNNNYF